MTRVRIPLLVLFIPIVQRTERRFSKSRVGGSNPSRGAMKKYNVEVYRNGNFFGVYDGIEAWDEAGVIIQVQTTLVSLQYQLREFTFVIYPAFDLN